jgi:hypothetical protein
VKKSTLLLLLLPSTVGAFPTHPCTIDIISPSTTISYTSDHCVTTHFCHEETCVAVVTLHDAIQQAVSPEVWQNLPYDASVTVIDGDGNTQTFNGALQGNDLFLTDSIFANGFEGHCDE